LIVSLVGRVDGKLPVPFSRRKAAAAVGFKAGLYLNRANCSIIISCQLTPFAAEMPHRTGKQLKRDVLTGRRAFGLRKSISYAPEVESISHSLEDCHEQHEGPRRRF
jgi:hypothetical protein